MLKPAEKAFGEWIDLTNSALDDRRQEACEQRLIDLPPMDLFDESEPADADALWAISYDAMEHPLQQHLHTLDQLRFLVLDRLGEEALYLDEEELHLLQLLDQTDGQLILTQADLGYAAESLARRLWLRVTWPEEDDNPTLSMQPWLLDRIRGLLERDGNERLRDQLFGLNAQTRAMLYLNGFGRADEVVGAWLETSKQKMPRHPEVLWRFLRAGFLYLTDPDGSLVLVHPALADDTPLRGGATKTMFTMRNGTALQFMGALAQLLPEEIPSFIRMLGTLTDAVRPEWSEKEAADDLRFLLKQGVPEATVREVLASMLISQPTQDMLEALHLLALEVVVWPMGKAVLI